MAGASVQLKNMDTGDIWEATSDAEGVCTKIDDIVPGTYVYSISLEGYETYTSNPFKVASVSGASETDLPPNYGSEAMLVNESF